MSAITLYQYVLKGNCLSSLAKLGKNDFSFCKIKIILCIPKRCQSILTSEMETYWLAT